MQAEHEEQQQSRATQTRSVRLTPEMMARLQAVCDHLGVTVGSYLTSSVGRAVAHDEVSLLAKQSKDNSMELLAKILEAAKD